MFNNIENLIINQIAEQPCMPVAPVSKVIKAVDTNTPRNLFGGNKTASTSVLKYSIDKANRKLIIDGHEYKINSFFNIENAINGDYKTFDYIFTYNQLNINDFMADEGHKI